MFGQTVTTSSDVLRQFNARGRASPRKWLILDGDSNGAGIVPYNYRRNRCRSFSPIQTRRGTNIMAEVQSPKTRSRRCCETMIFVPSSFIRLSEPISRGTVTGQRNSRTRLRGSCPTSRTSEHSSARGCDVRMFTTGWAAPRRRSCLPDCGSRTTLTQWRAGQFRCGSSWQIEGRLPQRQP